MKDNKYDEAIEDMQDRKGQWTLHKFEAVLLSSEVGALSKSKNRAKPTMYLACVLCENKLLQLCKRQDNEAVAVEDTVM